MFDKGLVVFSGDGCSSCVSLKEKLNNKGLEYTEFDIWKDDEALSFLMTKGLRGIPQLFLDGKLVTLEEV